MPFSQAKKKFGLGKPPFYIMQVEPTEVAKNCFSFLVFLLYLLHSVISDHYGRCTLYTPDCRIMVADQFQLRHLVIKML